MCVRARADTLITGLMLSFSHESLFLLCIWVPLCRVGLSLFCIMVLYLVSSFMPLVMYQHYDPWLVWVIWQLIRLIKDGLSEDIANIPHATLTYALELKPYIEEPVSIITPSSGVISFDLRPQIRHDFILSSRKALDEYWSTLEYSYAAADSKAALHAFPGSAVPEVVLMFCVCL